MVKLTGHSSAMNSASLSFLSCIGSGIGGAVKTFGSGAVNFLSYMSEKRRR